MYERREIIKALTPPFVLFSTSLPDELRFVYLTLLAQHFTSKALIHVSNLSGDTNESYSTWNSKADYDAAVSALNSAMANIFESTPDEYYGNAEKFSRVVTEKIS